ncbi:MAG TPA: 4-(cytidine 5'-diphospho)-2-C-methyl-D-erythritol kinase [Flavisolibacter sp.]|nr:4-(cytidine 5'-diphospho)-2-C-methyl-D-erythritol kinase [Flavisolibacter sp.]
MVVFPNCKINLGLYITRKRADGFHDLETVFYPIALHDALEIVHAPQGQKELSFTGSGRVIDGPVENNICYKAYRLLQKDFPDLPPIHMHLHKLIPSGAGLGGGSADGAFTLVLLNRKFNLGLSEESLLRYALILGSDCPFFIRNKPSYAEGRGEVLEDISLDLSGYSIVLVNPGIHISTAWAFSEIKPQGGRESLKTVTGRPVEEWRGRLTNDFEAIAARAYPEIGNIIRQLYESGALYAAMSGSGSTVFGLFRKKPEGLPLFPPSYFVKEI